MRRHTEAGFGHVVVLAVLVLVFAIVGFAGYKVMQSQNDNNDTTAATQTSAKNQATIDDTPQLKAVDSTLSDVATQIDSSLNTSTLDSDIQALY
jgi:uncharacterized protein HemX